MRLPTTLALVSGLALLATGASAVAEDHDRDRDDVRRVQTATPIKHIVVIFQENVSFDHYFGTYPKALNLAGETPFAAKKDTPKVNNLVTPLDVNNHFAPLAGIDLINNNPNNSQTAPNNGKQNGTAASNASTSRSMMSGICFRSCSGSPAGSVVGSTRPPRWSMPGLLTAAASTR